MKRRIVSSIALLIAAGCASPETRAPAAPAREDLHAGRLGHELGTYLSIGGFRDTSGKSGPSLLRVDTVNGQRLDPPVSLWVEDVLLKAGERVELQGYESGRFIGIPEDVTRATGEIAQAEWQFQRYFIATAIVSGGVRP